MNSTVIMRPIITEKSMHDAGMGKFTFAVHRFATRQAIKNAVQEAFAVTVENISLNVVKGGRKKVGARRQEKNSKVWKKAIITVTKGQKIDLFDIGGSQA